MAPARGAQQLIRDVCGVSPPPRTTGCRVSESQKRRDSRPQRFPGASCRTCEGWERLSPVIGPTGNVLPARRRRSRHSPLLVVQKSERTSEPRGHGASNTKTMVLLKPRQTECGSGALPSSMRRGPELCSAKRSGRLSAVRERTRLTVGSGTVQSCGESSVQQHRLQRARRRQHAAGPGLSAAQLHGA